MTRNLTDYTKEYLEQPFEPVMIEYRRKKTLELLGETRSLSILELGCGISPASDWIPAFKSLTVLEPGAEFYEIAKSKTQDLPNVQILMTTSEQNPVLIAAPFDVILINSLLHELAEPKKLLNSLHGYCHSSTRILINVPNAHSLHRLLAVHMGIQKSPEVLSEFNLKFQQSRVFTIETLTELISQCEYKIIHTETSFLKPFTHTQMQEMLDKEYIHSKIIEGLYSMSNQMPEQGSEIFMIICPR